MIGLTHQHCSPKVSRLQRDHVEPLLGQLHDWRLDETGETLERQFKFQDFHHTMAFVNAAAWIAHREDHHPEMQVGYNRCTIRYSTHSVGGLSLNDFICAAHIDALMQA